MDMSKGQFQPLSRQRESLFASLESKKHRQRHGLFVVQGAKSVADSLGCFSLRALCGSRDWLEANACQLSSLDKGLIFEATPVQLRRISSLQSAPPVIAVYQLPEPADVPPIDSSQLYLLLDGIQDPGNLGTIIRTADWFGVRTIFASPDTADLYNSKTLMATMGSIARVKVIYTDLCRLSDSHPDIPLYGTLLDGRNIYEAPLSAGGFIALGNEGNGLSDALRQRVTHRLFIPPFGASDHAESLNVAIASAVTLSEFRRRQL